MTETALRAADISIAGIDELNRELEQLEPAERIVQAYEVFAGSLVLSSSFGPTAPVLLKLVSETDLDIPVVTVRHGHETSRTLELIEWYADELDLDVRVYEAPFLEIPQEGTPAFSEFQQRTKVEPFQKMLDDLQPQAYLSGVMRWQSSGRAQAPFIRNSGSVVAVNPIVDLSEQAVNDFFEQTGLPQNDDYFDPAKGADQKSECGLNIAHYERRQR